MNKNISRISLYYNQINKDKVAKIFELLNIDNIICYIDDEFDKDSLKVLNNLHIDYIQNFNDTFNRIFLKLNKEKLLKIYDYMQERDVLISSTIIKDNWQAYLNTFANEICLSMLSHDTNCILEIDDYEKTLSVQFRKEKYNSKELAKNLKNILN